MITLNVMAYIEYGLLERTEVEAMVSVIAEAFSRYEPLAVAVGFSASEIERLISALSPKALAESLTVLAREASSKDLLGALLVEDFGTPPPEGPDPSVPAFAPIGALLEGLEGQYRASRTIGAGTHLHLMMLAVAQRGTGRGIAHQLISTCLANGKRRGFSFAVTEATGSVSQHVFRTLGFREVLSASYKVFLFDGQAVFSSVFGQEATILMEREL